jgi:hypothetical protein
MTGPTLNHVAVTMAPELLDDAGRAAILDFYGDVFGWTEGDNSGESGNPLILLTGVFGHFVYLLPGEPALQAPGMDHFGMMVETEAELDGILERTRARAEHDDDVRIIDKSSRITHGPTHDYTLTNCYIGYRMPLMVELQFITRHEHARG